MQQHTQNIRLNFCSKTNEEMLLVTFDARLPLGIPWKIGKLI